MKDLFNLMVKSDLDRLNELVRKEYYDTSDFEEAVLILSDSLAMYHQEAKNESCKEGEYLQTTELVQGV